MNIYLFCRDCPYCSIINATSIQVSAALHQGQAVSVPVRSAATTTAAPVRITHPITIQQLNIQQQQQQQPPPQ